ncbi:hypothetical protein [Frankia gtarii]|uniref:hypothetical protein n=1 Tax=Frankia gtarii TaxID=2950102 RepID=UPI0021C1DDE0|nr:hypothetical protein [Frankia gtarii]
MSAVIGFDSTKYDQLIAQVGKILQDFTDGAAGPLPLNGDLQLQPAGQSWQPAADLVAAGKARFGEMGKRNDDLSGSLTDLQAALVQARSIFNDTEDLAAVSVEEFQQAAGPHALHRIEGGQ